MDMAYISPTEAKSSNFSESSTTERSEDLKRHVGHRMPLGLCNTRAPYAFEACVWAGSGLRGTKKCKSYEGGTCRSTFAFDFDAKKTQHFGLIWVSTLFGRGVLGFEAELSFTIFKFRYRTS